MLAAQRTKMGGANEQHVRKGDDTMEANNEAQTDSMLSAFEEIEAYEKVVFAASSSWQRH
jgi:hypothetical protein